MQTSNLSHCRQQESDRKEEQTFKLEAFSTLQQLAKALEQWETQQLLGGQYDKLGAILSIQVRRHPKSPATHDCTILKKVHVGQSCMSLQSRQAALKRQNLSRTYLAQHELENDFVIFITIITIIVIMLT